MNRIMIAILLLSLGFTAYAVQTATWKDAFVPKTEWEGEIRQGDSSFPATIYVQTRMNDRIRGEIHFKVGDTVSKLYFSGSVIDGNRIAWITAKKEGDVTVPGLYIGALKGKTLNGTWEVPSVGQYDTFTATLKQAAPAAIPPPAPPQLSTSCSPRAGRGYSVGQLPSKATCDEETEDAGEAVHPISISGWLTHEGMYWWLAPDGGPKIKLDGNMVGCPDHRVTITGCIGASSELSIVTIQWN